MIVKLLERPATLVLALLLCAGAWTFSQSADTVLRDEVVPGRAAGGVDDLGVAITDAEESLRNPVGGRRDPEALVQTWFCFTGGWRTELWGPAPGTCGRPTPAVSDPETVPPATVGVDCAQARCHHPDVTARVVLVSRALAVVFLAIALLWLGWWRGAVVTAVAGPRQEPAASAPTDDPPPGTNERGRGARVGRWLRDHAWLVGGLAFLCVGVACQWVRWQGVVAAYENQHAFGWYKAEWVLHWLELGLFVAVAVPLVPMVASYAGPWLVTLVTRLWFPAVVITIFFLLLRQEQSVDVLRGWSSHQPSKGFSFVLYNAVAATVVLGTTLALFASRVLRYPAESYPELPRSLRFPYAAMIAALAGLCAITGRVFQTPGLYDLAIGLVLLGGFSVVDWNTWAGKRDDHPRPAPRDAFARMRTLGPILGTGPLVALALAILRAYAPAAAYRSDLPLTDKGIVVLAVVLLASPPLVAFGFRVGIDWLARTVDWHAPAPVGRPAPPQAQPAAHGPVPRLLALGLGSALFAWASYELWRSRAAVATAQGLGAVAVVAVFLATIVFLAITLGFVADLATRRPLTFALALPPALRTIGFSRPPVIGLLIIWALVPAVTDHGAHNDIRRVTTAQSPGEQPTITLDAAVQTWAQRQPPRSPGAPVTPLVFVSSSGGGIRAAYWTSAVLDCLIERNAVAGNPCGAPATAEEVARRRQRIFAMSGISGGSLGLVEYDAYARRAPEDLPRLGVDGCREQFPHYQGLEPGAQPPRPNCAWYRLALGGDYLAPTFARWLYGDIVPHAWLHGQRSSDRAASIEQAWEASWKGSSLLRDPFFETQRQIVDGPAWRSFLFLNGYSVQDGCRINVSVIRSAGTAHNMCTSPEASGPAPADPRLPEFTESGPPTARQPSLLSTRDLASYLCTRPDAPPDSLDRGPGDGPIDVAGSDISASTAALLSARFPFVTPAGRVTTCPTGTPYLLDPMYAVDGGYRDTSAASTITELWPGIQTALAAEATHPVCVAPVFIQIDNDYARVAQPGGPNKQTQAFAPLAAILSAPQGYTAGATQSASSTFGATYVDVRTSAHPGDAAPLGWVLSDKAMDDLQDELVEAEPELTRARALLDGRVAAVTQAATTYGKGCPSSMG